MNTPPPATMMPLYRARAGEVRALDLGDGRHVLLGETPRYMTSADFDATYELVPDRRAPDQAPVVDELLIVGNPTPASERMAAMIAARTNGDARAPRPRLPRGKAEVEQVLTEVRGQVDREVAQRTKDRTGETGTKLAAGAKPGTGRKACPKCHILSGSRATECGTCGHKFKPKG